MRGQVVPHSQCALGHVEAHLASELDRGVEVETAILMRFLAGPRISKAERKEIKQRQRQQLEIRNLQTLDAGSCYSRP